MQRLLHAQYCLFVSAGSMTLRYQIDPNEPLTFMDVKVGKQVRTQSALTRLFQALSSVTICQLGMKMLLPPAGQCCTSSSLLL